MHTSRHPKTVTVLAASFVFLVASVAHAAGPNPTLALQTGHTSSVNGLAFSRDGRTLASSGGDSRLLMWDVATGLHAPPLLTGQSVDQLAYSPDGKWLISSGATKHEIAIWDAATSQLARSFPTGHPGEIFGLAVSADGQHVAASMARTAEALAEIRVWSFSGTLETTMTGQSTPVWRIAFTADGKRLASAELGGSAALWDTKTGQLIKTLGPATGARSIAVSAKDVIAVGLTSGDVEVFALTGTPGRALHVANHQATAVAFSPDGALLAVGADDGSLTLCNPQTGARTQSLALPQRIASIAFSRDGQRVAAGDFAGVVRIWEVASGRSLWTPPVSLSPLLEVAFSPDGTLLATGGQEHVIRLWDLAQGRLRRTLVATHGETHLLSFSRDGRLLAAGHRTGGCDIWEVRTGKLVRHLALGKDAPEALAFGPDGSRLVVADFATKVRVYAVDTGEVVQSIGLTETDPPRALRLALSPDGQILAVGTSSGAVELFDAKSGAPVRRIEAYTQEKDPATGLAFTPDGHIVVAGKWSTGVRLFDQRGNKLGELPLGKSPMESLRVSPDGKQAVIASLTDVKVIDLARLQLTRTLTGHVNLVSAATFSPDGAFIASAGTDATLRLWRTQTGAPAATFIGLGDSDFLAALPDGHYTASKGAAGAVAFALGSRIYPFDQFDLLLNRPDLVLTEIGRAPPRLIQAYHRAYEKRLRRMGLDEKALAASFSLPELTLRSLPPLLTKQATVTLSLDARAHAQPLQRLLVYVNDVAVDDPNTVAITARPGQQVGRALPLTLAVGPNRVQVSVLDQGGQESLRQTLEITRAGVAPKPNLYVLAVGVSDYADSRYQLTYAAKDARDVGVAMQAAQGKAFASVKVLTLLDRDVSRERFAKAAEFLQGAGVDDQVEVFVAGHGMLDASLDYWFATSDMDFEHPAGRGLPYSALEGLFTGLSARRRLLLIDTCQSGEVDKEATEFIAAPSHPQVKARAVRGIKAVRVGMSSSLDLLQELFSDLRRGSGAVVISSASGTQFALESSEWKNGVFTYAMLQGLRSGAADLDKDGSVRASELRDYAIGTVAQLTGGLQRPTARRDHVIDDFRVY